MSVSKHFNTAQNFYEQVQTKVNSIERWINKLTSKLYCDRLVGDFLHFGKLSNLCLAMCILGLNFSMIDAELLV